MCVFMCCAAMLFQILRFDCLGVLSRCSPARNAYTLWIRAQYYTPDLTNMDIATKHPFDNIRVKTHWTSDNPLEDTTDK